MKTVAIIAEYNPFHNGHKYQIDTIRDMLGEDTAIIAVMSGNYMQRGEPSFAYKTVRAQAAVDCGVNLVLEIPFPFSMTSAEHFAMSGVTIASSLGVVDYLAFGSECGDISTLTEIAENTSTEAFKKKCAELRDSKEYRSSGHAKVCEAAYSILYGTVDTKLLSSPNNILAIEYIKALRALKSDIIPITITRSGAGYSESYVNDTSLQSATYIRELISKSDISAFDFMPDNASLIYKNAFENALAPADITALDTAIISYLRINPLPDSVFHDAGDGLYNRLRANSFDSDSLASLINLTETKKYTKSRIRRAIFNSYFGVTSSDILLYPKFTQILAMDTKGTSLLKRIRKMTDFPVITKPSDYSGYGETVERQKQLAFKADSVYSLLLPGGIDGRFALTFTPYVKKAQSMR